MQLTDMYKKIYWIQVKHFVAICITQSHICHNGIPGMYRVYTSWNESQVMKEVGER